VSKEWEGEMDDPQEIYEKSLVAQKNLLSGMKGSPYSKLDLYEESNQVKHVALSLTGEPIIYPKVNELIELFHSKGVSTFLVTNGQYPKEMELLVPITQLYLSMDAPTKELLKDIDKPLFSDYWERFLASLDALAAKKGRTCVRVTLIKGLNMSHLDEYADLLKRSDPDFVEVKGYMHVGESRERLEKHNMPFHEDIVAFTKALVKRMPEYDIVSEHVPSRVVLLAKKTFFIDKFPCSSNGIKLSSVILPGYRNSG